MSKDLQKRGIAEIVRIDLEDTASVTTPEDAVTRTGVTPKPWIMQLRRYSPG